MAAVRLTGQVARTDVAAVTVPAPSVAAAGGETIPGTGHVAVSRPGESGSGTAAITGSGAARVGAPALAGTGTETIRGTGAGAVAAPGVHAAATETVGGGGASSVPEPEIGAMGAETIPGTGTVTTPATGATGSGTETISGAGTLAIPAALAAGTGTSAITGRGAVEAPSVSAGAVATVRAPEIPPWPDVEAILRDALADLGTTGNRTPADLAQQLPFLMARRIGGADTDRITDIARVAITVYAATLAEAKALAGRAQQRILAGRIKTADGIADRGATETAPSELATDDPDQVRGMAAIYRVSLRRRPS